MKKYWKYISFVISILLFFACSEDVGVSPTVYTVTFQANGGTIVTSKQTVEANTETMLIKAKTLGLTNGDKTFVGWGLSPAATNATYDDGGSIILQSDITLYAMWKAGTIETEKGDTSKNNDNSAQDTEDPTNETESKIEQQNTFGLYHEEAKTWTIYFDANGGSIEKASQTLTANSASGIGLYYASQLGLVYDGYTFVGWATKSDSNEVIYADGATISELYVYTLYLYAVWQKNADSTDENNDSQPTTETTYTIMLDPFLGTYSDGKASYTQSVTTTESSATITLKTAEELGLQRENYEFAGWIMTPSATEALYTNGETISVSESILLYALWKPIYTLTLYTNGSAIDSAMPKRLVENSKITLLTAEELGLSREDYIFLGWATTSNATEVAYADGANITISADTALYAVWEKSHTYKITFDANGGNITTEYQLITSTDINASLTLMTAQELKLTRNYYVFAGWATQRDAIEPDYADGENVTIEKDIILYAIWWVTAATAKNAIGAITEDCTLIIHGPLTTGNSLSDMATINTALKSLASARPAVTISLDMSLVTEITKISFTNCSNLKSIILPNSITEIGFYAFQGCTSLETVVLPASLQTYSRKMLDMLNGEDNKNSLKNLIFKGTLEQWLTMQITDATKNVPYSIFAFVENFYIGDTLVTDIVVPESVTAISDYAFYYYKKLKSITFNNIETIGKSAFMYTGLSSVIIPDSVTTINDYAFAYCTNLTTVSIGKGVNFIGQYAFLEMKHGNNGGTITFLNQNGWKKGGVTSSGEIIAVNGEVDFSNPSTNATDLASYVSGGYFLRTEE